MFKDLFSLKGRVAVVTGGSRGIGKMIAAGFLAQGAAKVYITARKAGPCEATAKELTAAYDGECIALPIDISTNAGCELLAAEIIKREPKLDILVNNAGAAWGAEFDEFPENGWDKVMDLNVKSLFFLTKALHKPLRAAASAERPAKVINIASILGMLVDPLENYSYGTSKAAVIHLTRQLAIQADQGAHQRHRDRAGRVRLRHEQGGARSWRRAVRAHSRRAHRHRRGHGGAGDLLRLARRRLCGRQRDCDRRRRGLCDRGAGDCGVERREGHHDLAVMPRLDRGIRYAAAC